MGKAVVYCELFRGDTMPRENTRWWMRHDGRGEGVKWKNGSKTPYIRTPRSLSLSLFAPLYNNARRWGWEINLAPVSSNPSIRIFTLWYTSLNLSKSTTVPLFLSPSLRTFSTSERYLFSTHHERNPPLVPVHRESFFYIYPLSTSFFTGRMKSCDEEVLEFKHDKNCNCNLFRITVLEKGEFTGSRQDLIIWCNHSISGSTF